MDRTDPATSTDLGQNEQVVERIVERVATEVIAYREMFAGPLPHPETLRQYAELYPRAPEIVFEAFAQQSAHRRELESFAIRNEAKRSFAGLAAGLIVMLGILGLAFYTIHQNYTAAGVILALAGLAGVVSVFVIGIERRRSERIQKAEIMAGEREDHLSASELPAAASPERP